MKQGQTSRGYTIVEVLIVLAISAALLVSAILFISGQQARTEFSQAINDINTEIRAVANDVASGFYPSSQNFVCTAGIAGPPVLAPASVKEQGTNEGCIFLGKVIQFGVANTDRLGYSLYTVVANRQNAGKEVQFLSEARPTIIDPANYPTSTENKILKFGLRVVAMKYQTGVALSNAAAVAFLSTLGKYGVSGDLLSGSQAIDVYPINGVALDATSLDVQTKVVEMGITSPTKNPDGIYICFQGGTGRHAIIAIGGGGRQLTTDLYISGTQSDANALNINGATNLCQA